MPCMSLLPLLCSGVLLYSSGSVVPWLHMSPHNICAVRLVIYVVRSVHFSWETCQCIHSWIRGRFFWSAVHHNYIQGIFLQISSLPSRLLSPSAAPEFWGGVVRAASQHILFQNHQLSRKIGWASFMAPETRCCGWFIVARLINLCMQQIIVYPAWLR